MALTKNDKTTIEDRCIDGPHNYIFLCREAPAEAPAKARHDLTYEVFYCSKCLKQSKVKAGTKQGYKRW